MRRLWAIIQKEFIQMRRDRLTLAMMVMLPIVQLLVFGFAINTDVKHLSTVVFDQSKSQESRELTAAFTASGYFDVEYVAGSYQEVEQVIAAGKAKVGLIFPPDYVKLLKSGRQAQGQLVVDASDSMASSSAISTSQLLAQRKSSAITAAKLQQLSGSQTVVEPLQIRVRPWYNPDAVTAYYMVPGIIGTVLTMTMVMITSMAIVRERERGTLEQLIVTPLKTVELLAGKIIPYILVGYLQMTLGLIVGHLVFDMPMRGSYLLLYALTFIFIVASLSLGVLISNVAKTQMQAMQMSFFIFLPSLLLSGFMFPREAMPKLFFYLSNIIPLTFYLEILRGIILKGVGLEVLWPQGLALAGFISVTFGVSLLRFRRSLE